MAETTLITLSASAYTALGTTQTAVGCFVQPSQRVRLCVATNLPAANTTGFVAVEPASGEPYLFVDFTEFGIGAGDEVYALSEYGSAGLVVVRGTASSGASGGGDASAAKQDTGNASLASIDGKLPARASGLATTQNALSVAAEVVIAANASRVFAEVKNVDTAINVYLGDDNTVSAANGHKLAPGEAFDFEGYTGAVWAIAASGTPTVTTVEW